MGRIWLDIPDEYKDLIKNTKDLEACFRQNNGRIKNMVRFAISSDKSLEDVCNEITNTVLSAFEKTSHSIEIATKSVADLKNNINEFTAAADKLLKSTGLEKTLDFLNVGLNAANLCATAAGFAIMSEHMEEISRELDIVSKNVKDIKEHLELLDQKDVNRLINNYANLLNNEKLNREISIDERYNLMNEMYLTIQVLLECFNKDVGNRKTYLNAISVLLPIYILTVCKYDQAHYFTFGCLHENRKTYTKILDEFKSYEFFKNVQEYVFLQKENDLNSRDAFDAAFTYITSISEQLVAIEDNLLIIKHFKNEEDYNAFRAMQDKQIVDEITKIASEKFGEEEADHLYNVINQNNVLSISS